MNELGTNVLKVMEGSSLGLMSVYVLSKQSSDLGLDLNTIDSNGVVRLSTKLKTVLPFFLGDETDEVLMQIRKIANGDKVVMT
jgi:hypothetical protein